MRKRLLLGAILMGTMLLAGCGFLTNSNEDASNLTGNSENEVIDVDSQEPDVDAEVEPDVEEDVQEETIVTIDPWVIADVEGVKITAVEYIRDDRDGVGDWVKYSIENTREENISVMCEALKVNGFETDGMGIFFIEVASGETVEADMQLYTPMLTEMGMECVEYFEVSFSVVNEGYNTIAETELVKVTTSAYGQVENNMDCGTEIYNANNITIWAKEAEEDSLFGTGIVLTVKNDSDSTIYIHADSMKINGTDNEARLNFYADNGETIIHHVSVYDVTMVENAEVMLVIDNFSENETIAEETISFSF